MEHLFEGLYAPVHWEAYSAPRPVTGARGVRGRKEWRGIIEKVAEGKCKGENEREREKGGDGEGE